MQSGMYITSSATVLISVLPSFATATIWAALALISSTFETGDGILSSLQLLQAVLMSGKKPSELSDEIEIFPQVLRNARVKNENKRIFMEDDEIKAAIAETEQAVEGSGRLLIRPSGTEPLVRVMLEGQDVKYIETLAEKLADLLTKRFG